MIRGRAGRRGERAMNETMLAILGFAAIIMLIFLLLRNVTAPAIAFVGVSAVTAVILAGTGTFTIGNGRFYQRRCKESTFYGGSVYLFGIILRDNDRRGDV